MKKSTLKSKIISLVALSVVFFTTFFVTFSAVRSVLRDSHASEDISTLTVTTIWDDNNDSAGFRPTPDGIILKLVPAASQQFIPIGTATSTTDTPTITDSSFILKNTDLTLKNTKHQGFIYDTRATKHYLYETNLEVWYNRTSYPVFALSEQEVIADPANPVFSPTSEQLPANLYVLSQPDFDNLTTTRQDSYQSDIILSSINSDNWTIIDDNTWIYTFTNLNPKITYSFYEEHLSSYQSTHMGAEQKVAVTSTELTITNTLAPTAAAIAPKARLLSSGPLRSPTTSPTVNNQVVKVIKEWNDNNNAGDTRPNDLTIHIQRQVPQGTGATFMTGLELNTKLKKLVNSSAISDTADTTITAIKKADALPSGFTPTTGNTVSAPTSDNPIYVWLDGTTIYYYSDAEVIFLNSDATGAFKNFRALTDISGLQFIETYNTSTFHSVFQNDTALTNIDALSGWDVSNANTLWGMFQNCVGLTDISGVAAWDVSNATNIKFMFGAQNAFIDDTTTPMQGMALTDLTPLKYWNPASATSFNQMFKGAVHLVSLSGLEDWDVRHVTDMSQMFEKCVSLTAAGTSVISGWDLNSSISTSTMFQGLDPSIIPTFTGSNTPGSGASGGTGGGSTGGSTTTTETTTINGWTKKSNNTWEKEIIINGDFTYTIWEDLVDGYTGDATSINPRTITGNRVIIRNSLNQRNVTITKNWDDNDNAYNSRPSNIKVYLSSSGLPAAYQEVEYIEATGTQYINTGLTGNTGYTYYVDGFVRHGGNGVLINNYVDNNNRMGTVVFNTSNARVTCYWISGGTGRGNLDPCISGSSTINLSDRFQLTQSKSGITVVQDSNTLSNNYNVSPTGTNSGPIYLFHSDQPNAVNYGRGVLYGAKIYDSDGTLLRDFVPAYRKSDSAIGMYDKVTEQFFTNAGSGTFLKGSNVSGGGDLLIASDDSKWTKSGNTWTYTFSVPNDITALTTYEDNVPGYNSDATKANPKDVVNDAATINNTVATRTINLTKTWDDTGHADARPSTINARLFTINMNTGQFQTVANVNQWTKSGNTWTASITISDSGDIYMYEDSVTGYLSSVTPGNPVLIDPTTNTASITNTYIPSPKTITITKQWVGDTNNTSLRQKPTVHLVARDNRTPAGATLKTLKSSFANDINTITNNTPILYLHFYSNGHFPSGYNTLTQLQTLPHADVSEAKDNSIIAYYNSSANAIYIRSQDQITAPQYANGLFGGGGIDNYSKTCIQSSSSTPGSTATNALGLLQTLDISELDTSQTTYMFGMFSGLSHVSSLDISNFDFSNVTSTNSMFRCNTSLTTIYAPSNLNLSNISNTADMFTGDTNLIGGNGTTYNSSYTDGTYARTDASGAPGYFTTILDPADYQFVSGANWNTSTGPNTWTYQFTVPNNDLVYEVYEDPVDKYDGDTYTDSRKTVGESGATIVNTLGTQEITVTKVWNDGGSSNRPSTITAYLAKPNIQNVTGGNWSSSLGNTTFSANSLTVLATSGTWTDNGDNTWEYVFNITAGEDAANLVVYEDDIPGYTGDATITSPKAIPANKSVTITNIAGHFDVNLKKQVTGNLGVTTDTFNFNFKIYDNNGTQLTGDFAATINGVRQTITFGADGYSGTFAHGDTITVHDLLTGYSYTITEADTAYSESYKITTTGGTVLVPTTNGLSASRSLMNESQIVTFENNLEKTSTGISTDILIYLILLLIIISFFGGHQIMVQHHHNKRLAGQTFISLD